MNYPFCTIEPNVGRVGVPDPRLYKLAGMVNSEKIIPTQIEIVDIAGLVKGASKGEGLGNQFLGHIRSTDAILHFAQFVQSTPGAVHPRADTGKVDLARLVIDYISLMSDHFAFKTFESLVLPHPIV